MKRKFLLSRLMALPVLLAAGCISPKETTAPPPKQAASVSPSPLPSASPLLSPAASAQASALPPQETPRPGTPPQWKAPGFGKSVIRVPHQIPDPPRDFLHVPKGWKAELVADKLEHPRWMARASNGDVFVVESRLETKQKKQPNRVTVLRDTDGDGIYETRHLWADNLYLPFGIAFHDGYLYVANTNSVVRWPYADGQMEAGSDAPPEVVVKNIPERGMRQHWTRNILFSPDGSTLYLTIGSKENADVEEPLRGTIASVSLKNGPPFGPISVVASGMRNPVGLQFHPKTGKLWAVVNERDYLGDDLVPDFLTEVKPGGFYGWPYYFIGPHHDPRLPYRADLKESVLVPDVLLGAHGAPLGLVWTPSGRAALVARHGSQNRRVLFGYDIVRVSFDDAGRPVGKPETVVSGWLPDAGGANVYGRPAGLLWDRNTLLIADDWGGRIWRITPAANGFDK